jgi:redox-sensitive bicupin YhaK (pirin superfamily)
MVEVIAGHYQALNGAASTFSPVHLLNVKLEATASANFSFPAHYNTAVLVLEGAIEINGQQVPTNAFALFENSGEEFTIKAKEKAQVLVLSGEPINEPIAAHGPFVMNTRQEIMQAMHDYNTGKFGYLD